MIKKPTQEEVEIAEAGERLEREQWADIRQKELAVEEKTARLQYSTSLRLRAWTSLAKAPAHITAMWLVFWLVLFGKPVPMALEKFLLD